MSSLRKNLSKAIAVGSLGSFTSFAITITTGNLSGVDNVVSNNGSLIHSGALIQGDFNPPNGYIVDFVSSGGNLLGSGGQSNIKGDVGNDPFSNLKFYLENNATFTKADLNPDAIDTGHVDGTITFTVKYFDAANAPQSLVSSALLFSWNGENRYGISADGSERISSIEFNTSRGTVDVKQVRIGGFADALPPEGTLPDGGATVLLLGSGMTALAFLRRKLS